MSSANIQQAYLDLYTTFTKKGNTGTYSAIDGQTIYDLELNIDNVLEEAQKELINLSPLQAVKYREIPKPNGETRGIYSLSTKDRIKCQAIYRVLENYFEPRYSKYIYSFRSSQPSYYASRSVRRFYLRNHDKDMYVMRLDIYKYADYIDHDYLINVLKKNGIEQEVIDLIKLFLRQPIIKNRKMESRRVGVLQGMTLCSLFYNIYIGHIDDYIGKNVAFYRRIGDDLILFDPDETKLLKIKKYVDEEAKKAKIRFNEDKDSFGNLKDTLFTFHGLHYNDGIVSLPKKNVDKIVLSWKKRLKYNKNSSNFNKINKLKKTLQLEKGPKGQLFMQHIRAYNLITDTKQITQLSKKFFHLLTKYFTGGISYQKMNRTKKLLYKHKFPTFAELHYLHTNGLHNKIKTYKRT